MADTSVIIIGAGLAGLSAGCYAQMNGYASRIFEHADQPGGVAATWTRGAYTIDGGIHFVMGHKPSTRLYDLYRELGIAGACPLVDMDVYGRFTDEASGRSVLVTRDLNRLAADLKALSPVDGRFVDEIIGGARDMQGLDLGQAGMSEPPEIMNLLGQIREMWEGRRLAKYMMGKYARSCAEYARRIGDPWLRYLVSNLFMPEAPVWFVLMVLAILADGQLGLLAEGVQSFVRPIEKRYKDLGGEVVYEATVEEILVENDRAVGVRLADGSRHRAGAVISAADAHSTLFGMLGGHYVDAASRRRFDTWPLIRPAVMISYGLAREFPGEPWMMAMRLAQPLSTGRQVGDGLMLRIFNYSDAFAPPGKSVVQALFETEWDFWADLREDRVRYEAEKERAAQEVLQHLEAHYPGIAAQVEVADVATPYTTWRYTRNYRGAYMGWLPTPEVITARVKRTLPGLSDFYMAGQWVMPGGGVPPCLYSGRHAVQLLCRRDGKRFVTIG